MKKLINIFLLLLLPVFLSAENNLEKLITGMIYQEKNVHSELILKLFTKLTLRIFQN